MTNSKSIIGFLSLTMVLALAGCTLAPNNSGSETNTSEIGQSSKSSEQSGTYNDGVYTVDGTYNTPAGEERIGVTVTLSNGIIEDVEVEKKAVAPISQKMQADFAEHYKPEVVGKNIDEVELSKVSGSSLTPNGFNNAIEQIKTQAQS